MRPARPGPRGAVRPSPSWRDREPITAYDAAHRDDLARRAVARDPATRTAPARWCVRGRAICTATATSKLSRLPFGGAPRTADSHRGVPTRSEVRRPTAERAAAHGDARDEQRTSSASSTTTGAASLSPVRPSPASPHDRLPDLEGVLVPGSGSTSRRRPASPRSAARRAHEPDYDKLMRGRLEILDQHELTLRDIQEVIDGIGAVWRRRFLAALGPAQVIILSDTFYQFAAPLMRQLDPAVPVLPHARGRRRAADHRLPSADRRWQTAR